MGSGASNLWVKPGVSTIWSIFGNTDWYKPEENTNKARTMMIMFGMYTLGQKFSDLFLRVSNFQINLSGLLQIFGIL